MSNSGQRLVEYSVLAVLGLAVFVWGDQLDWQFGDLSRLNTFPLLGLIAFSTMWWHFFTGFVGRIKPDFTKIQKLHDVSNYWVFASFILHPALLVWYANDIGYSALHLFTGEPKTPVDFHTLFNGKAALGFILLGYLSLVSFLAYDLARWLRERPLVKNNWFVIEAVSDAAFVAIWVHSLNLGRHLQGGWFRVYWIGLGLSGIAFILHRYRYNLTHAKNQENT